MALIETIDMLALVIVTILLFLEWLITITTVIAGKGEVGEGVKIFLMDTLCIIPSC